MADSDAMLSGTLDRVEDGTTTRLVARGAWVIDTAESLDKVTARAAAETSGPVVLDLSNVTHIDTAGAWLITRIASGLAVRGVDVETTGLSDNARRLLAAVQPANDIVIEQPRRTFPLMVLLERLGGAMANAWTDVVQILGIFGGVIRGVLRGIVQPSRLRFTSIVHHIDRTGLQAVPIIALISLLIGGIVAQQGVFQLRFFGAEDFVVDLVGILVLRELGVLLTAIMLAGRSGSAYTAEIGSMKMREEIDALTVIGLNPVGVLIFPRLVALTIVLPLLTIIANFAALYGAAVVALTYSGITFDTFLSRLHEAIDHTSVASGMIKAPFMALAIGIVAAVEGMKVGGSAESLGRHVTSSVVKAIFAVILMDALFAIFYSAIDF